MIADEHRKVEMYRADVKMLQEEDHKKDLRIATLQVTNQKNKNRAEKYKTR
jgi:hypothetical protein